MITLTILLASLLVCILPNTKKYRGNRMTIYCISVYASFLLLDILTFVILGKDSITYAQDYPLYYLLCAMITMLLTEISMHLFQVNRKIHIYKTLTFLSLGLFNLVLIYFLWLLSTSGRMPFDMFIYNLQTPVNHDGDNFQQLYILIVHGFVACSTLFYIIYRSGICKSLRGVKGMQYHIYAKKLIPIIIVSLCTLFPIYAFHLEDAYAYYHSSSEFIERNYVDPNKVTLTWPNKQQNLIYIFVESFEASYASEELGGINKKNLIPNLTDIMSEEVNISHTESLGGYLPMPFTGWTIAGMNTLLGGVNYRIPQEIENDKEKVLLPELTTLNDLLKNQGYEEYFIIGSNANNYHIGPYVHKHGDAQISDLNTKKKEGALPDDYKEWWGFEDRKLYDFAREDLTMIAQKDKPFMYIMATNDTHTPKGYTDKICDSVYDTPYENSIACTDIQLSAFLHWLKQQPFYENTTIAVIGDHLGHDDDYFKKMKSDEQRRGFNLILNSQIQVNKERLHHRQFWAADLYPTVLAAMGVEIDGNRLGLGVNLFSNEATIIERYGSAEVEQHLSSSSEFYDERFLGIASNEEK